ncbi:hypothetical protein GCM10009712_08290 [Pseudarthrobacter sulfonivorans]|uniref:hypothetical protein n=1 Tax=Pseudarthrobacter sulfonivorans TaxID=121292 RepID=UPI00168A5FEB|nr:hypothetical protein [Pseudarthrobacter sulfonivorans]
MRSTIATCRDQAFRFRHCQYLTIDATVPGYLTIRLDPLPTRRATTAIAELCDHLPQHLFPKR